MKNCEHLWVTTAFDGTRRRQVCVECGEVKVSSFPRAGLHGMAPMLHELQGPRLACGHFYLLACRFATHFYPQQSRACAPWRGQHQEG